MTSFFMNIITKKSISKLVNYCDGGISTKYRRKMSFFYYYTLF